MKKIISLSLQIIAFKLAAKLPSKHVLRIRLDKMNEKQIEDIRNYLHWISFPPEALEPEMRAMQPDYTNAKKDLSIAVWQLNMYLRFKNARPFKLWVSRKAQVVFRMFF